MGSEHGGLNYTRLRRDRINPDEILDFSVSINPAPLPRRVLDRVRNSNIIRYPDSDSTLLREKIAGFNNSESIENILVVNGTSQGMFLIAQALLKEQERVGIISPSYSEYYDACRLKTDKIDFIRMKEESDFQFPLEEICSYIERDSPRLIWICSPNNPTGTYLNENNFEQIRQSCLKSGTLFLLDEAYICFVPDKLRYNSVRQNVLVLRSMTKDFGFPGLRLGYLMGEKEIIDSLRKWQPDWSINAPAQDAGSAGFEEMNYFRKSWQDVSCRMQRLRNEFAEMGLKTYNSDANFFLMNIHHTETLKEHLWKSRILVRDCRSFGLPDKIRIGVGTEKANKKLTACFKEYLKR